jgi:hypothetical protein
MASIHYPTQDGNSITFEWLTDKNTVRSLELGIDSHDRVLIGRVYPSLNRVSMLGFDLIRETPDGVKTYLHDYEHYKPQVEAFLKNDSSSELAGTPLKAVGHIISDMRIADLVASKITTVEALLSIPDGSLAALGSDMRTIQTKVREHMESLRESKKLLNLIAAERDKAKSLEEKLMLLESQMSKLKGGDNNGTTETTPKEIQDEGMTFEERLAAEGAKAPGRPRKNAA